VSEGKCRFGVRRRVAAAVAASIAAAVIPAGRHAGAAETDNLTYRFLSLKDSAPAVNAALNRTLGEIADRVNRSLEASGGTAITDDTEVERLFLLAYRDSVLHKFGDRLLPVFGACVERDDCPGWPKVERIVLLGRESIYGESGYNLIAIRSLAPSFDLCGVRVGTDKLTHLFSNGFFYYNASRRMGSRLRDGEDVYRMSLDDEHGLMGARSTAVVSPADAAATRAGYELASGYFGGDAPVFERDASSGLLVQRRAVDVCRFVSPAWDEAIDPPLFTAGRRRVARIEAAIAERVAQNAQARSWSAERRRELRERVVGRALPPDHGRLPFFYKIWVALKWGSAYLTISAQERRAIGFLVFPDFSEKHRRPIVIKRSAVRDGSTRPSGAASG